MRIFLASAAESREYVELAAKWIEDAGHEAVPWFPFGHFDCPFKAGKTFLEELLRLRDQVDGALCIFSPDDVTMIRETERSTVRDNVLFEFGLFLGCLGVDGARRLVVGNVQDCSDLSGLVDFRLARPAGTEDLARVQRDVQEWLENLLPANLTRLHRGLRDTLLNYQDRLGDVLGSGARELLAANLEGSIRAVCSDKGAHGRNYYAEQFLWVREAPERTLKRVFIRTRPATRDVEGFSFDEAEGILQHLDARRKLGREEQIEIRYFDAAADHPLRAESNALGFAVFGKDWLVHWGTKCGTVWNRARRDYVDERQRNFGDEIRGQLVNYFDRLWRKGRQFDDGLVAKLRIGAARGGRTGNREATA